MIKYLDSKRISFASTFRDDFTGGDLWVDNDSATGVSSNKLDFQMLSNGAPSTVSVHDLTSTDNEKWVLRFHSVNFSTLTASSNSFMSFCLSSGNQTLSNNGTQSAIIHRIGYMTGGKYLYAQDINNQAPNNVGADGSDAYTYLINTSYDIEIARTSATTYTVKSFIGGFDGTPVASTSGTCSSGLTGLRYIKIFGDNTHGSESGNFTGTIGKVEFFDGVITASYPTNVQDNSILVEKDTGKRYWFDADSRVTLLDGTNNGATTGATGKIGNAWDFNGAGDYVNIGTSTSDFNFMSSSTALWSVNLWVKFDSTGTNEMIYSTGTGSSAIPQSWLYRGTSNDLLTSITSGVSGTYSLANTNTGIVISDTNWHMVTLTYDQSLSSNNLKAYKDGSLAGQLTKTGNVSTNADSNQAMRMFGGVTGVQQDMEGLADEMSIWNRALSSTEITTLYNSGTGITVTGSGISLTDLKAYYNFEQTGNTLENQLTEKTWTYENTSLVPTVAGLKLHLDASDSTTITKDSSNLVSAWNDKSGQANHVVQATGSKQPLWVDRVQDTLPIIRFDGTDDFLKIASWSGGALATSTSYMVFNPTSDGDSWFDSAINRTVWLMNSGTKAFQIYSGANMASTVTVVTGEWVYCQIVSAGASSIIRRDGITIATGNAGTQSFNGIYLGSGQNTAYSPIDVAELLVYEGTHSTSDRDAIEAYLAKKWGL